MKKKKMKTKNPAKVKIHKEKKLPVAILKKAKKYLFEKRADLLAVVLRKKHLDMPDNEIGDEIDSAMQTVEKELLFELTNNEKIMLDEIEASIRKIEKKSYGQCESCNKLITISRLKAMPWARYCILCQKKFEKQS